MQIHNKQPGFTLLEVIVTIGIIGIISTVSLAIINPVESLKKSRDSRRVADFAALSHALAAYVSSTDNANLGACMDGVTGTRGDIMYSYPTSAHGNCFADVAEGLDVDTPHTDFDASFCLYSSANHYRNISGNGWLPINFTSIPGGSPLTTLPVDPINLMLNPPNTPTSADLVYRYACQAKTQGAKPAYVYELNAVFESKSYISTDHEMSTDGGDNDNYYEVGTSKQLLGNSTNY